MIWQCKAFNELSNAELYTILRLRNEVFIVEQNCPYQDLDNKDQPSFHLMGFVDEELAAYARVLPQGISYQYASIGRVITSPKHRRSGAGKELMMEAIKRSTQLFGDGAIKLGAQLYLKNFYESFGFKQTSEMYLEDGIPHIEMLRDVS